ncbi:hypothetical protein [Gimesia maris]|uniref:hypothetical protein n=1 Tax=Gimesia maris TaxID=122 RepID=UPI0030D8EC12|tara:strand:- start:21520 stop:22248 length:729 start_codon:yes stop_codon:yes gene_type:complete
MQPLCPECQTPLENNSSESSGHPPLWVCRNLNCSKFVSPTAVSSLDEERIRQIISEENESLGGKNTAKSCLVTGTLILGANLLTTTIDYYDLFRLGSEIVCPGSIPDLEDIAHKANEYINQTETFTEQVSDEMKTPQRFLVFNEQWRNLGSQQELDMAVGNVFSDGNEDNLTFISEASGVVDQSYFDRGLEIVGTGSGGQNPDAHQDGDFPDYPLPQGPQSTPTPAPLPPPSYPGSEGLDYA